MVQTMYTSEDMIRIIISFSTKNPNSFYIKSLLRCSGCSEIPQRFKMLHQQNDGQYYYHFLLSTKIISIASNFYSKIGFHIQEKCAVFVSIFQESVGEK